ncbi:MAG: TIGR02452 family protein [Treponema sp.]|nr:TIGR02452 family protein [Treponema sp.]
MENKKNYFRELNTRVMNDTQNLCFKINWLRNSIRNSINNERVIFGTDEISPGTFGNAGREKNNEMKILLSTQRTFEAAMKYKGKKIACLDFANAYSVGGSPWTAGAQEESMCRISTLYQCIYAQKETFYEKHIRDFEAGCLDEMGNDDIIYVPDVTVFKSDESEPELMNEDDWFLTDVIVSAAPELWKGVCPENYEEIMTSRIKRILDAADFSGVQVLVLGAFGCGAFCNPPESVARIFASLIKNYGFETVEFAVFCREDKRNFEIFRRVFEESKVIF